MPSTSAGSEEQNPHTDQQPFHAETVQTSHPLPFPYHPPEASTRSLPSSRTNPPSLSLSQRHPFRFQRCQFYICDPKGGRYHLSGRPRPSPRLILGCLGVRRVSVHSRLRDSLALSSLLRRGKHSPPPLRTALLSLRTIGCCLARCRQSEASRERGPAFVGGSHLLARAHHQHRRRGS